MAIKIYENQSDKDLNVLGVGNIPAGERVSISGEYLPQVIMENYPGLVDVTNEPGSVESDTSDNQASNMQNNLGESN